MSAGPKGQSLGGAASEDLQPCKPPQEGLNGRETNQQDAYCPVTSSRDKGPPNPVPHAIPRPEGMGYRTPSWPHLPAEGVPDQYLESLHIRGQGTPPLHTALMVQRSLSTVTRGSSRAEWGDA